MKSLVGTWRLVGARTSDAAGRSLPSPLGPQPMGVVIFEAERMVGVIGDARASIPSDGQRFFAAYTGSYSFDGTELVTKTDDASNPELIVEQVRHVRFESSTRIVVTPVSGVRGLGGSELVWELLVKQT